MELVGLLILFLLILVACYFVTKFVAGKQLGFRADSNFKVIDFYRISQNKVIQLLKVGDKYIVIAICKDSITKLTELTEDEIHEIKTGNSEGKGFKDIFSSIVKKQDNITEKVDINEES